MKNIDWKSLGFSYMDTNCHVRYVWKDGQWDAGELVTSPTMPIHIAATALHYGQAAFEGLKAFRRKDGKASLFRPEENAKRMQTTARRTCMAEVPTELFVDACKRVVKANLESLPPVRHGRLALRAPVAVRLRRADRRGPGGGVHVSGAGGSGGRLL